MSHMAELGKRPCSPPRTYWLHTSEDSMIRDLVRKHGSVVGNDVARLLAGGCLVKDICPCPPYASLDSSAGNLWSLLYISGYLTLASGEKRRQCGISSDTVQDSLRGTAQLALVIPNREVRTVFAKEVANWFRACVGEGEQDELCAALWAPDATRLVQVLEDILIRNINSHDLARKKSLCGKPGRARASGQTGSSGQDNENALLENVYHGLLTGHLLANYKKNCSNLEAGHGRFAIQVTDGSRAFIMEIKRADREDEDLAALVDEGLGQIAQRHHDACLLANPDIRTILHWSVAFCQKRCLAGARVIRQNGAALSIA